MDSMKLQPPDPFNFKNPDDWLRWKRRFEQFRHATGLSTQAEERQVSTLLYCAGQETEDILRSTDISNEERGSYNVVLAKLDEFFKVRRNIIFERARFNRRNQQEKESAEEYIAALYNLAENYEYGTLKSEMIRDRLVVGIRDSNLSERLQTDSALTLEKAKIMVRQREAVQEQQGLLKGETFKTESTSLDAMRRHHHRSRTSGTTSYPDQKK